MREEIANMVFPVISYGLRLKERLAQGADLDLYTEQMQLKKLIVTENEAGHWKKFGGDGGVEPSVFRTRRSTEGGRRSGEEFLGIGYALACWLDEIFILDSPWESEWREHTLEMQLYGMRERATRFWEQAKLAESRQGGDALEVYFLCAVLGFRGELGDDPARLRDWFTAVQARITRNLGLNPPNIAEDRPPSHVPPRVAQERMQRMVLAWGGVFLLVVPVVAFLVARHLQ
jgi:type VI secretion system protein ImpK